MNVAKRKNFSKPARSPIGIPALIIKELKQQNLEEIPSKLISARSTGLGKLPEHRRISTLNESLNKQDSTQQYKIHNLELVTQYQSLPSNSPQKVRLANQILEFNQSFCRIKSSVYSSPTLTSQDFFSLAQTGMFIALIRFDPTKSGNFAVYAARWIKKFCLYAIASNRMIHVPDSAQRLAKRVQDCLNQGITEIEEIAESLNKDASYVLDAFQGASRVINQMPVDEHGNEREFIDSSTLPLESVENDDHLNPIREALAKLPPQTSEICLRMADGMDPRDIAELLGLDTREVNQIYKEATAYLKAELAREVEPPAPEKEDKAWPAIKKRILRAIKWGSQVIGEKISLVLPLQGRVKTLSQNVSIGKPLEAIHYGCKKCSSKPWSFDFVFGCNTS